MNEFRTIPELQDEIRKICQAFDNDDITGEQFEAAAADLHQRIKDRKLAIAMQGKAKEMDALKNKGIIDRVTWTRAITAISKAKNETELNAIQPQNLAR